MHFLTLLRYFTLQTGGLLSGVGERGHFPVECVKLNAPSEVNQGRIQAFDLGAYRGYSEIEPDFCDETERSRVLTHEQPQNPIHQERHPRHLSAQADQKQHLAKAAVTGDSYFTSSSSSDPQPMKGPIDIMRERVAREAKKEKMTSKGKSNR